MSAKEYRMGWVPIRDMKVDESYQRKPNMMRVREMAEKFDATLLRVLDTSLRQDGKHYIIDGQHRYEACKIVGHVKAYCRIFEGLTVAQEAALFNGGNASARLRPTDNFRAALVSGSPDEVEVTKIARECGFAVSESTCEGQLSCVTTLMKIFRGRRGDDGPKLLRRALGIAAKAWGKDQVLSGDVLDGLAILLGRFNGEIDNDRMARILSAAGDPSVILGRGRALRQGLKGTMSVNIADAIRGEYNTRLSESSRLPPIRN